MTVMLKAELEVQRRLQHPLRHRYARFTKVLPVPGQAADCSKTWLIICHA